jgi:hypothetical protein
MERRKRREIQMEKKEIGGEAITKEITKIT